MQLWKVTQDELTTIVGEVSREQYDGNVTIGEGTQGSWDTRGKRVEHVKFGLRVKDSSGPGARRSVGTFGPSRRMIAACWHLHRDIMLAIFDAFPEARLKTALADYRGRDAFEDEFPETYYANIGSLAFPAYMGDACEC